MRSKSQEFLRALYKEKQARGFDLNPARFTRDVQEELRIREVVKEAPPTLNYNGDIVRFLLKRLDQVRALAR